jgi:hypothetical protein
MPSELAGAVTRHAGSLGAGLQGFSGEGEGTLPQLSGCASARTTLVEIDPGTIFPKSAQTGRQGRYCPDYKLVYTR